MRPLTVITGILLGTFVSIAFSLGAVLIVYLILGDEYPRVQHEFKPLTESLVLFTIMTVIAGWSFYCLVKSRGSVLWSQLAMWLGLFATGFYYWPK